MIKKNTHQISVNKGNRLYQELEKKYKEDSIKQEFQAREARMQEIKESRKPISKVDLINHKQKYDDLMS
jgi:hypothetical protein